MCLEFFLRNFSTILTGRGSGLDKDKLEVYFVMDEVYNTLNVDYASLLWA